MLIEKTEPVGWIETETQNEEPPTSKNHSRISHRLNVLLSKYEDKYEIMPEFDIELPTGKARPDIAICAKGMTFNWWKDEIWSKEVPISIIEILSPTQPLDDIVQKTTDTFFLGGVKSAWLVLPSLQSIYVITADRQRMGYTAGEFTDPVTGISMRVEEVFR